ncbi:hypothetical protein ACJRO7_000526 [Eucalyptus globulus]|uniref:tyrosine--tRNA ligase n=1 Tax=Eucalyptus globulus TaxID=34317 RepID=A0ABD3LMX9_EUCGL
MEIKPGQNSPPNKMESLSINSQAEGGFSLSCPTAIHLVNGLVLVKMSSEERFRIVRSVGEECIQEDELLNLLTKKPQPICYDGFEPSGRMHIAQGVMKTISVNKMTSAGCKVKILMADWFAQMNKKMGGDLEKIQNCWTLHDGNMEKRINSRGGEYWPLVLDILGQNRLLWAYCPPKIVEGNPCLEYIYIILPWFHEFGVEHFKSFDELVFDYESGDLHPGGLKLALSKSLNKMLQFAISVTEALANFSGGYMSIYSSLAKLIIRFYLCSLYVIISTKNANLKDLLKRVRGYRVTR